MTGKRARRASALAAAALIGAGCAAAAAGGSGNTHLLLARAEDAILARILPDSGADWQQTRPGTVWDSCQDTPVLLNVPPQHIRTVETAIDELNRTAGARFRIVGHTDRTPGVDWALRGERIDENGVPAVLIAIADAARTDMLRPGDRAAAVANPIGDRYVTGAIFIDRHVADTWHTDGALHRLLLHELGHLAGLTHAGSHTIMSPHVARHTGPEQYTAADREGLRRSFHCAEPDR